MDRDLASLSDIRRVATELMAMREKYALDAVLADDVLTSAVLHKTIVMGEAANRVSTAGRAKWAPVVACRLRLVPPTGSQRSGLDHQRA